MRIKRVRLITQSFLGIICSVMLIGCTNNVVPKEMKSSAEEVESNTNEEKQIISEYKSEIESLQVQAESLNEKNQYLVTVIKQVTEDYSDEEMLDFSHSQVRYDLKINGESIPQDGQVTIPAGKIEILLGEQNLGYDFVPAEWIEKGKLSGNYIDHIVNFDTTSWTETGLDGTVNSAQGYFKTNAAAGDQFSFSITDELKSRLKLDTNLIQIKVN